MRLSLFSRLIIGYLAIFILVTAVSVYAIVQLRRFNDITRSILETDTPLLEYEKKLTDALLSQIRYERRFVISKDDALLQQFRQFQSDFEGFLKEAMVLATPEAAARFKKIAETYQVYRDMVIQEAAHLRANQGYPRERYKREKDRMSEEILAALEGLRADGQRRSYERVRALADAGARASRAAVMITVASLIFIIAISLVITRSITSPIAVLKRKTGEIAKGDFSGTVELSSPPEMGELAAAVNFMCEKLRDLDKMKSDFFASMSHELRTPLTSIKEGTGLLLDGVGGAVSEKQRKLLTILAEESDRLIGLVNSLLDLSKMEAGMMTYRFEQAHLVPLIRKATLEITPLVEAKKIELKIMLDDNLPSLRLDSERILQALRNLIGNAVKFTPHGGHVTVAAESTNDRVKVSVIDSGPGIPAEDLAAIFDKFHQGKSERSYLSGGSGLGLAIAKHVVKSHGGEIWAENRAGHGSIFSFVLPVLAR